MGIISPAIKSFLKLRTSVIDNFMLNPIDTQLRVFNNLIGTAQFTEYGKKYDFQHINSIADFQRQVPLNDYESLKPYIQKILEGKPKYTLAIRNNLVCEKQRYNFRQE